MTANPICPPGAVWMPPEASALLPLSKGARYHRRPLEIPPLQTCCDQVAPAFQMLLVAAFLDVKMNAPRVRFNLQVHATFFSLLGPSSVGFLSGLQGE